VDPRAVALWGLDAQTGDLQALAAATAARPHGGFLVVIDYVGAGHSNLDRVTAIRPRPAQGDGSLVYGCAENGVRRAVLRALVG
jgi:EAL domain-containing protein (putative c-di-GMP-specific phosphodiesterase class I)